MCSCVICVVLGPQMRGIMELSRSEKKQVLLKRVSQACSTSWSCAGVPLGAFDLGEI